MSTTWDYDREHFLKANITHANVHVPNLTMEKHLKGLYIYSNSSAANEALYATDASSEF